MKRMSESTKIYILFGSLFVSSIFIFALIYLLFLGPQTNGIAKIDSNGNQVVNIIAKNGFNPSAINIEADKPSVLKITTNQTYDCSSTLVIPKLGINKVLPTDGETDIDIPAQTAGTVLDGTCSGGIYHFSIKVS